MPGMSNNERIAEPNSAAHHALGPLSEWNRGMPKDLDVRGMGQVKGSQVGTSEPSDAVMLVHGNVSRFAVPVVNQVLVEFKCARSNGQPGTTLRRSDLHSQLLVELLTSSAAIDSSSSIWPPGGSHTVGPASPVGSPVAQRHLTSSSEHASNSPYKRGVPGHHNKSLQNNRSVARTPIRRPSWNGTDALVSVPWPPDRPRVVGGSIRTRTRC